MTAIADLAVTRVAEGAGERRALPLSRFPFAVFLLFVVTLPLEATLVLEVGFTIRLSYLALMALTAIVVCQSLFRIPSGSFGSPLNAAIALYLGVSALSLVMTVASPPPPVAMAPEVALRGSEFRSLFQLGLLFLSSLAYFYTVYFCPDAASVRRALRVYLWCAVVVAGYGVYQFFAELLGLPFVDITNALGTGGGVYHVVKYGTWYYFRSHGTFQEPLNFGHYLLSVLPLVCGLALYRGKRETRAWQPLTAYRVPLVLMGAALFLTRSRGAWVGFAVGLLVLLVVTGWKARVKLLGTLMLAGVVAHAVLSVAWPDMYALLWSAVTGRYGESQWQFEPRLQTLPFTLGLFREHPLLGVGLGSYALHKAAAFGDQLPGTAYGVFWQTLAETGLLGLLAFGLMLARFYQVLLRALRKARGGPWYPYLLGYLAAVTAMMVQYLSFADRLNLYAWFLMGAAMATVKLVKTDAAGRR